MILNVLALKPLKERTCNLAQLRTLRGSWYARSRWRVDGRLKEKLIPLRTKSKVTARERIAEVNKVESDIKSGMEFSFPWITDDSSTKIKRFNLLDATNQWMLKRQKYRNTTLTINKQGINYFTDCLGNSLPLESITNSNIDEFIEYMESKGLRSSSINIHLRTIKTMFRYWLKRERINKIPIIEQIPIRKTDPIYITDDEFHSIMNIDWMDNFYKRVFLLYRETGMRLREPMLSVINGSWIDIPNESKGGASRNIELDKTLQFIFIEYEKWLVSGYGSKLVDAGDHISKMFKKALIDIGADRSKHFHSLRHTFAVRRLIQGTSIYDLKLLMGHSSVTTTEVYSEMNLKRISQDFPTIVASSTNSAKIGKWDTQMWDTSREVISYIA